MAGIPRGLRSGGKALWVGLSEHHDLDAGQVATLEGACRQRDRADLLASAAGAGDASALRQERDSLLAMARLIAALRLPNEAGKRPQARQLRGVQQPSGKVSSLDKARAAKSS